MEKPNRMSIFFEKVTTFVYLFGLSNFSLNKKQLSPRFLKFYDNFRIFNDVLVCALIISEWGAFFTQTNLTPKQKSNSFIYCITHSIIYGYRFIMASHTKEVRNLIQALVKTLKAVYNDPEVEKRMIRSSIVYSIAMIIVAASSIVAYTFEAYLRYLKNETFTTVIPIWPDVNDTSYRANVARLISNIILWIFLSRVFAVYTLFICVTVCLGHQFINLQSYFKGLYGIFEDKNIGPDEKGSKYIQAFKVGIRMHSETLRCTKQYQAICRGVVNGQIIFNITLLVILMAQMTNADRTVVNTLTVVVTGAAVLISTGFLMWNAGDVTVEASRLGTAIYFSGWHHCHGHSSIAIRGVVPTAMLNAEKPVVLRGLTVIDLSYQSYLSLVKSSYSVFSVLY